MHIFGQRLLLNQRQGKGDRQKYFMINFHRGNATELGLKLAKIGSAVRRDYVSEPDSLVGSYFNSFEHVKQA